MIRAAESTGIVPIVRVSDINEAEIKRVLDCGAARRHDSQHFQC